MHTSETYGLSISRKKKHLNEKVGKVSEKKISILEDTMNINQIKKECDFIINKLRNTELDQYFHCCDRLKESLCHSIALNLNLSISNHQFYEDAYGCDCQEFFDHELTVEDLEVLKCPNLTNENVDTIEVEIDKRRRDIINSSFNQANLDPSILDVDFHEALRAAIKPEIIEEFYSNIETLFNLIYKDYLQELSEVGI